MPIVAPAETSLPLPPTTTHGPTSPKCPPVGILSNLSKNTSPKSQPVSATAH